MPITVKELIEILKTRPEDEIPFLWCDNGGAPGCGGYLNKTSAEPNECITLEYEDKE